MKNKQGIRVVVVEDSQVAREFLVKLLGADPAIDVVGTAADGLEGFDAVRRLRPDVVTMDIHLPGMNGYDTTRRIMEECPVPVVIVTADWDRDHRARTFKAIETGAVEILEKPPAKSSPHFESKSRHLVDTVKAMAEVKVVTRRKKEPEPPAVKSQPVTVGTSLASRHIRIVAFGVSTGGPAVLRSILSRLPWDYPVPIVIALHIVAGFATSFAKWLDQEIPLKVVIAENGIELCPGYVYVAPGGRDMEINQFERFAISQSRVPGAACPSVAALFASVAETYGPSAAGVLLTGMGRDGAEELKLMRQRGAVTFAQDKESSTIHGMPGEAIRIGAAQYIQSPVQMADSLLGLVPQPTLGNC